MGYKKIPLRDTRGVLNNSNNFKYYRESYLHNKSTTYLPSGTKITFKIDDMDTYSNSQVKETLTIKKFSGKVIKTIQELGKKRKEIFVDKKPFAVIE